MPPKFTCGSASSEPDLYFLCASGDVWPQCDCLISNFCLIAPSPLAVANAGYIFDLRNVSGGLIGHTHGAITAGRGTAP